MAALGLAGIHHVALITADYPRAKHFYVDILGATVIEETWRAERESYKLDLSLPGGAQLELFSFPAPPPRVNRPEACGLRHLAFACKNVEQACRYLQSQDINSEPIRVDELTGKRFTFFQDPDGTPLELYEMGDTHKTGLGET